MFTNVTAQSVADALAMVYDKLQNERAASGQLLFAKDSTHGDQALALTIAAAPEITRAVLRVPADQGGQ
jgi:hypothetical protein